MSDFIKAWNAWVAEGLSHEECVARATQMQRDAIALYESEHSRLTAIDPLLAEYYERAWNSVMAGCLQGWSALAGLPKERLRQLRRDANYLNDLCRKTGGW